MAELGRRGACGMGWVYPGGHFRSFKPISWGTSGGLRAAQKYMHFRRVSPTSGGLSLPHGALPVSYPPGRQRREEKKIMFLGE